MTMASDDISLRTSALWRLVRGLEQPLKTAIRAQPISRKTAYVGQIIADDYFLTAFQIISISKTQVWLIGLTDFIERYPPVQKKAGDKTDLYPDALDFWSSITPEQLKRLKRFKQYEQWLEAFR